MSANGKSTMLGKCAVVIGAGMGGMMAAGVLSRFFEQVRVLERDALSTSPQVRKCVPQGAHAHGLLVQGRRNLEKIFPGLTSDLIDGGAVVSRVGTEFRLYDALGWHPKRNLGLQVVTMTRPFLEQTVREHLHRLDNVQLETGVEVNSWQLAPEKPSLEVKVSTEHGDDTLAVDFLVDATGRAGATLNMLQASGFGPVEETTITIGEGYVSALFRKPPGWDGALDSCYIGHKSPNSEQAFGFSVEGDCWIISLTGRFSQRPPRDLDGFMAFLKRLPDPTLYNWASQGEKITPIKSYQPLKSNWRRYERLAEFPQCFLPLGDALAHVNPIFGQGMTLASTHAMSLWEALQERAGTDGTLNEIAKPYFKKAQTFTEAVWRGLEPVEYSFTEVDGDRPADIEQRQKFGLGLRLLLETDLEVQRLCSRVQHLIDPPEVLQRSDITARVGAILEKL